MKKSVQMRQELETMKNEMEELLKSKKVKEAKDKLQEIKELKDKILIQEELEEEEEENIKNKFNKSKKNNTKGTENKKREAFAKYVRREKLTNEEESLLLSEVKNQMKEGTKLDGGALVPFDEDTSIITLREADDALQNLVTTIPVNTLSGKKTVRKRRSGGSSFKKVGEGQPIGKGKNPQFVELDYNCDKYAAIYDITNELIDDSTENVISELNQWIGHDSRENRNNLILAQLATKEEKVPVTGYDDIKDIINTKLNTANAKYASIITNQDGYNFLDKIKDETGNYILQPVVGESDKYVVKGKKLYVYDNTILPTNENKVPIIIGDMKMSVVFFDRRKVAIKITDEGGDAFDNDLTLMRAIERQDVQTLDEEAYVYGEIDITPSELKSRKQK